jgi:hypothetical protein
MRRVLILLLIVLIGVGGVAAYGYTNLRVGFEPESVGLELATDADSLAAAGLKLLGGDIAGAAASIIEVVRISGDLRLANESRVPVYVPRGEHIVYLNWQPLISDFDTPSMWIGPGEFREEDVNFLVEFSDIPSALIGVLVEGGDVVVTIESSMKVGPVAIPISTEITTTVSNALRQALE